VVGYWILLNLKKNLNSWILLNLKCPDTEFSNCGPNNGHNIPNTMCETKTTATFSAVSSLVTYIDVRIALEWQVGWAVWYDEFSVATQSRDVRLTSADSSAPPRVTAPAAEPIRRGSTNVSHWGKALRPATRPVSSLVLRWSRANQNQKAVGRSSLITCFSRGRINHSDVRWASPKLWPQLLI